MLMKSAFVALLGLAAITEASVLDRSSDLRIARRQNNFKGKGNAGNTGKGNAGNAGNAAAASSASGGNGGGGNAANPTCLSPNALQTGSQSTGQQNDVAADGQANSAT